MVGGQLWVGMGWVGQGAYARLGVLGRARGGRVAAAAARPALRACHRQGLRPHSELVVGKPQHRLHAQAVGVRELRAEHGRGVWCSVTTRARSSSSCCPFTVPLSR